MKNLYLNYQNKLHLAALLIAIIAPAAIVNARSVSFKNEGTSSVKIAINNGRSKLDFTLTPDESKLLDMKPDSFWDPRNVHYVTHNEKIYIKANDKEMDPFEAQKINTYIALSSDNDALNDAEGHTIALKATETEEGTTEVIATTPNPELNAWTSKIKSFYLDNKEAIDSTAKDAANKLADKAADKFFDADDEEQEELVEGEISISEDEDGALVIEVEEADDEEEKQLIIL